MEQKEFIEIKGKYKSPSTISNYQKALKKLNQFLKHKGITDQYLITHLKGKDTIELCQTMQEIIDYIKGTVSPRVTKEYYEIIESYFALNDLEIPPKQKSARISFPKTIKRRFEGLDEPAIKRILEYDDSLIYQGYYSCGYGAGMRETEALLLTPSMFRFDEDPIRVILPGRITKFNIPRETFIAKTPGLRVKKIIDEYKIKDNKTIFVKEWNKDSLGKFEHHFGKVRELLSMHTKDREKYQQNDITLHSFRAFFTTVFMDNNLDWFGLAITGHSKYMDTYFRKSLQQRQKTFNLIHDYLNF